MVEILVATYQGEAYIAEQLDSLLAQEYTDFHITAQDDCSHDGTFAILQEYQRKYPEKISATRRAENSGSAWVNFMELMTTCRADYLMLCDQDDVWLPDKITKTLAKTQEMEARLGQETPILVHTDLIVVDERLQTIQPSFRRVMNADYSKTSLNYILIQNILTGCTAMYNRALANLLAEIPDYMVMHDWWLSLVASAFGRMDHIRDATIRYRQHGGNQVGASDTRTLRYKLGRFIHGEGVRKALRQTYAQAEAFLSMYGSRCTAEQIALLEAYVGIPKLSKAGRLRCVRQNRFWKNTAVRKLGQILFI